MHFQLTPISMTLDDPELQVQIFGELRRFTRQQQLNE